jgi:hypothetical protein
MGNTYFKSGQWNVICDVCGKRYKIGEVRKRWDGLLVCNKDFEQDHPQKYLRVRETGQAVPIIRDEPLDDFREVCDLVSRLPYAAYGTAGCATVGFTFPLGNFCLMGPSAYPNMNFADCMIAETP